MAKKPYDETRVQAARTQVLEIGGAELLVEAGMVAAMFEMTTKLSDGSRKRPFPVALYVVASHALWLAQIVYDTVNAGLSLMQRN